MSAEENKAIARRLIAAAHAQDSDMFNRLENGKVVESEVIMDTLGHLKQLGATIMPAIELPVHGRDRTEASHA